MALYVRNATNRTLNVALGYRWDNCPDGDNWGKKGWWLIGPGGTATVQGGLSNGAKYFVHVHAADGTDWGGRFTTYLPPNRFDWCWPVRSSNSVFRGFHKILVPVDSFNHTVVVQ
jgi:uncharacterized membrane protein